LSLFHAQTPVPISAKFCTNLHTSSTLPIQPPDPGVPKTPKPKQITGEKLCFTKNAFNPSWAAPSPGWLVNK